MTQKVGKWVLFAVSMPWNLVGYLYVVLSTLLFLAHCIQWDDEDLRLTAQWRPWAARLWRWSTTLGRGTIFHPSHLINRQVHVHERIHMWQTEGLMLLSFVVGVIVSIAAGDVVLGAALWATGGAWQLPNFLVAMLRFGAKHTYRGSEHERSAYAQTTWVGKDRLWADQWIERL